MEREETHKCMDILSFGGGLPLSMHKAAWTAILRLLGSRQGVTALADMGNTFSFLLVKPYLFGTSLPPGRPHVPEGCLPDSRWAWKAGVAVPYLRLHVRVVVVLQEQSGCLCVVFAGRNVEGRETHLPLRVVLEQEGHNLVMTLLQSHSQWREAVL